MWLRYYATLYPTTTPADFAQYCAMLGANLKERGRIEALAQMLNASKAASAARVGKVVAPTLVLMGSKDPDFKDQEAEASWVATNLRGRYAMVTGAGHYPHAEMPAVTGPRVLAFLHSLPPATVKANDA